MAKKKSNVVNLDERKEAKAKSSKSSSNNMMVSIMNMTKRIEELKTEKQKICEMAARTILKALDAKDKYTYGHSMRVTYFSMVLGKELGLNDQEMYDLQLSALFHDIGKIGTPDAVLNKPTRLNDEEFKIMKKHPTESYEILKGFSVFEKVARFAKHHHERYDGRGYPDGLKGEQIPLYSRIILIADTFDAMTSTRVYRKGLSYQTAYEELNEFSGSQFDPELVVMFIRGMKKEQAKKEDKFYIPLMDEMYEKDAA
ncbi:MAG: phosphohydrolase [Halobacteriovoraceae bacterium]|nr:phosphohydrolase [Halobacteriovoraceae bacterium]|tara:strand:- start:180273 stop:181040 length:768 start_codon:yes stop_codon:yes gene_type:complete